MLRYLAPACVCAMLLMSACQDQNAHTTSALPSGAPSEATKQPAQPPPTPVALPSATATASSPGAVTVTVVKQSHGDSGVTGTTSVSANVSAGAMNIAVHGLTHYCSPIPSFTGSVKDDSLVLTNVQPDEVSRCFAPYELDLQVDLPAGSDIQRVVLLGTTGKEIASAVVTKAQ